MAHQPPWGKIGRAIMLVSLILIASGVFLSQADRLFGKAQTAAITGMMVLHDSTVPITALSIVLPGSSCNVNLVGCGDSNPTKITSYGGIPSVEQYSPPAGKSGGCDSYYDTGKKGTAWSYPSLTGLTVCASGGECDTYSNSYWYRACNSSAGYSCAGVSNGCCSPEKPYYNSNNGKCFQTKLDVTLTRAGNCGYTYSPLTNAPVHMEFDQQIKYADISYTCT